MQSSIIDYVWMCEYLPLGVAKELIVDVKPQHAKKQTTLFVERKGLLCTKTILILLP